jgi:hypothetical protein
MEDAHPRHGKARTIQGGCIMQPFFIALSCTLSTLLVPHPGRDDQDGHLVVTN